jgi:hypothetical protein
VVTNDHPFALYLPDEQGVRAAYITGSALQRPGAYYKVIAARQPLHTGDAGGELAHVGSIGVCLLILNQRGLIAIARPLSTYEYRLSLCQ